MDLDDLNEDIVMTIIAQHNILRTRARDIAEMYHEVTYVPKAKRDGNDIGKISNKNKISFGNVNDFQAAFTVRGCGCGCTPDYDYELDIPIEYLWNPEPLEAMQKEYAEQVEKERQAEIERENKYEEKCRIQKEEYDKKEYERLSKKYRSE